MRLVYNFLVSVLAVVILEIVFKEKLADYNWFIISSITISGIFLVQLALRFITWLIYDTIFVYSSPTVDFKKYGEWAVVTGCTDGIGKAITLKLAKHGMKLILISRSREKLDALSRELKEKYHKSSNLTNKVDAIIENSSFNPNQATQQKIIVADFSNTNVYENIREQISGLNIGIIVNNVGTCNDIGKHCNISTETINRVIQVNCLAATQLTSIICKIFETRKKVGCVINLSSSAAMSHLPYLSLYAATRKYIETLTDGIRLESSFVELLTVKPYWVCTNLSGIRKEDSTFLRITPEECAEGILKSVGKVGTTFGSLSHHLLGSFISVFVNFEDVVPRLAIFELKSQVKLED